MIKFYIMVFLGFYVSSVVASDSLCESAETELFGCKTKGKIVSLCSSHSGKEEVLIYKFGTVDKIELTYPSTKRPSSDLFFLSSVPTRGGNQVRVRFARGEYDYFIYVFETDRIDSGVVVRKNDKILAQLKCDNHMELNTPPSTLTIPREEFDFNLVIHKE